MTSSFQCHLSVGVRGLQLELGDGLPHALLDPHAGDLQQRQRVVHRLDGYVEGLSNLTATTTSTRHVNTLQATTGAEQSVDRKCLGSTFVTFADSDV